jgi:hypothetical protein
VAHKRLPQGKISIAKRHILFGEAIRVGIGAWYAAQCSREAHQPWLASFKPSPVGQLLLVLLSNAFSNFYNSADVFFFD